MPIRPVPLAEATPEQRREFARTFLNLELTGMEDDNTISAKIEAAQPGANAIFVNEPDTPDQVAAQENTPAPPLAPEEATGRMAGGLGKGDPRAIIFIPITDTEDGSGARDVLVGVNGRGWQLKRGVNLPVPWRVVEALENAEAKIVRHRNDEGHEGEVDIRTAKRFPIQFIQRPSDAEIKAWHERTDAEFCA